MANQNKPARLQIAEGNPAHMTKLELAQKAAAEPKPHNTRAIVPVYLLKGKGAKQRKQSFDFLYSALSKIGIWDVIDSEQLARYVDAEYGYQQYTILARKNMTGKNPAALESYERNRDRCFKQAQQCANALGLNVTSRCKIQLPESEVTKVDF